MQQDSSQAPPRATRFRALGHEFGLAASDPAILHYLEDVFAPLRTPGAPTDYYRVEALDDGGFEAWFAGERLVASDDPARAVGFVLWHVNQAAIASRPDLVRLHAAGAVRGRRAVVLPAPMESGKTTLVAGLVRRGLHYLSDEVVAFDSELLRLVAYPKALSIDPGSWRVLSDMQPRVDPSVEAFLPAQWQVPVGPPVGQGWVDDVEPSLLVFPRYDAGDPTVLTPLSTADAAVALLGCTFDFEADPARNLAALADLAKHCRCYRLSVADLDTACGLIETALDDIDAQG